MEKTEQGKQPAKDLLSRVLFLDSWKRLFGLRGKTHTSVILSLEEGDWNIYLPVPDRLVEDYFQQALIHCYL